MCVSLCAWERERENSVKWNYSNKQLICYCFTIGTILYGIRRFYCTRNHFCSTFQAWIILRVCLPFYMTAIRIYLFPAIKIVRIFNYELLRTAKLKDEMLFVVRRVNRRWMNRFSKNNLLEMVWQEMPIGGVFVLLIKKLVKILLFFY